MNLQELLKERERIDKELEKYDAEMKRRDELQHWWKVIKMSNIAPFPSNPLGGFDIYIPDHIREVLLNALQAEIDKIEKE